MCKAEIIHFFLVKRLGPINGTEELARDKPKIIWKISPDSKKFFRTLNVNMCQYDEIQLGYCVLIKCTQVQYLTVRTDSLQSLLETTAKALKTCVNQGIGQYFPNTLCIIYAKG